MHRSAAVLAALALLGLGAVAPGIAPAGAAPPADVSATSGAPGTVVTVTEPTCTTDEASEDYRVLQVLLISGTTPGELLAGIGSGDGSASVVVPDWVDPDSPAVLEARCERYDPETFEPIVTSFDPVAFDVLPGPGSPTQTRTYSRTSLLAGQGLTVSHTGCTLPGATYGGLVAFEGTDLSGRAFERVVAVGEGGGLSGPDFTTGAAFTGDGFLGFSVGWDGEEPPDYELGVEEVHEPVPPGTYAAVSYCAADDGTVLIYEPQLVEVTGTAPVDQLDLTVAHGTRQVTLAGSECTAGPVTVTLEAMDVEEMFGPWDDADELRSAVRAVGPQHPARRGGHEAAGRVAPAASQLTSAEADEQLAATGMQRAVRGAGRRRASGGRRRADRHRRPCRRRPLAPGPVRRRLPGRDRRARRRGRLVAVRRGRVRPGLRLGVRHVRRPLRRRLGVPPAGRGRRRGAGAAAHHHTDHDAGRHAPARDTGHGRGRAADLHGLSDETRAGRAGAQEKELPHPQVRWAFGLSMEKPAWLRPSL